jgi:hypothetical protein
METLRERRVTRRCLRARGKVMPCCLASLWGKVAPGGSRRLPEPLIADIKDAVVDGNKVNPVFFKKKLRILKAVIRSKGQ